MLQAIRIHSKSNLYFKYDSDYCVLCVLVCLRCNAVFRVKNFENLKNFKIVCRKNFKIYRELEKIQYILNKKFLQLLYEFSDR